MIDPRQNPEVNINCDNIVPVHIAPDDGSEYIDKLPKDARLSFEVEDKVRKSFCNFLEFLAKLDDIHTLIFDDIGIYTYHEDNTREIICRIFGCMLTDYNVVEKAFVRINVKQLCTIFKSVKRQSRIFVTLDESEEFLEVVIYDEIYNKTETFDLYLRRDQTGSLNRSPIKYDNIFILRRGLFEKVLESARAFISDVEISAKLPEGVLDITGTSNGETDRVAFHSAISQQPMTLIPLIGKIGKITKKISIESLIKYSKNEKSSLITKMYLGENVPLCIEYDIQNLGTIQIIIG